MCTAQGLRRPALRGQSLTMCGSWMLARLWIRDWLRLASSWRRDSFCCSITLFSSSMVFRLLSMVVIWNAQMRGHVTRAGLGGMHPLPQGEASAPDAEEEPFCLNQEASTCRIGHFQGRRLACFESSRLSTRQLGSKGLSFWKGVHALGGLGSWAVSTFAPFFKKFCSPLCIEDHMTTVSLSHPGLSAGVMGLFIWISILCSAAANTSSF